MPMTALNTSDNNNCGDDKKKFSLTEKYLEYLTRYSALFHVDNTASLPIQDYFPFD